MPRPSDRGKPHPDPMVDRGRERQRRNDERRALEEKALRLSRELVDKAHEVQALERIQASRRAAGPNRAQRRGSRKAEHTLQTLPSTVYSPKAASWGTK